MLHQQEGMENPKLEQKKITYEQKANDMLAAVNEVTKDPFYILGFSDGAYTAYKIASMHPERIKKIIAIGAGENIPGLRRIPLSKLEDLAQIDANYIKEKLSLCPEPEKLQNFLDDYFTFFNNEKISKDLFNTIQCPALLIVGELDQNAPLDTVLNAYKMIPKSQLAVIANAPHVAFLANFEAVWANIKPFLNL